MKFYFYQLVSLVIAIQEKFSSFHLQTNSIQPQQYSGRKAAKLILFFILFSISPTAVFSQESSPIMHYRVSILEPANHTYTVELNCSNLKIDTIHLKMPKWMPGYYQIIDYAKSVENLLCIDNKGKNIPVEKINDNTWAISGIKNKSFNVKYTIRTEKEFVANSFTDSSLAYIIPENTFLYIEGFLKTPVSVSLVFNKEWNKVATGLDPIIGKPNEFSAPDFDILYDCPILIGNLQELPSFNIKGIKHRFIGYKMADFDHQLFIDNLKKTVEAASSIIGDVPYKEYTFIAIGPGRGGIEHLNNTTISFDGLGLDKPEIMNKTMNFIAHEYFHHYNVKRIRPFELGPFDYDAGNRTNLLWISEGLTVYYEYLILKRAGLANAETLLADFNGNLNSVEKNPGRHYQSLQQSSYSTWSDGPFGTQGNEPGKSISYYDKGPIVGLLLDFEIRNATQNKKSLDDVMRMLYWKYYKKEHRGFTEAEFQVTCEQTAGISLTNFFEYVYTTKELDYEKYLAYGGLKIEDQNSESKEKAGTQKLIITKIENPSPLQAIILKSWLGE
jgi:predicted metalloprotease with PDZ domain